MNPFRPGSNSRKGRTIWKKISEELLSEGVLATERGMRQRAIKLMDNRERGEKKTPRTGEEEMYGEYEQLLDDLIVLRKEAQEILAGEAEEAKAEALSIGGKTKQRNKSIAAADAERVAGLEIRNVSLSTMETKMDSSGSEDEQDREEDIALVENGAAPSRTLGRGVKKTSKNIGIEPKRFRALTAADKICGVMMRMSDAENERLRVREAAELELKKTAQRQEDRRLDLQEMELETKRQQLKLDRERMEFDRLRWEAALNKY
ncbi:hypothetical protein BV898_18142 [Hypsibius exemplaris]|uniref:Uncharacterized protein n=1 Tax=Hypsibius exemplaris TaxID=2072580 RepID=A0A9X6RN70_HYPEX|nr:hypothetical protein BV898_18142 [Hypsibius exemplaris]